MRTLAFLCMLLITPPSAQAVLTLADLDGVTGAQFTAGPLVFRDFDANLLPFAFPVDGFAHPRRLEDIPVVPLDHGDGGFTLATPFIAFGGHNKPSFVHFGLRFTVETAGSASIVGFTVSVDGMVANGIGGATLGLNGSTVFSLDPFNNNVGSLPNQPHQHA